MPSGEGINPPFYEGNGDERSKNKRRELKASVKRASTCQGRWGIVRCLGVVVVIISPSVKTYGFAGSLVRGSREEMGVLPVYGNGTYRCNNNTSRPISGAEPVSTPYETVQATG